MGPFMWIPCYLLGSIRPLRYSTRLPTASSGTFAAEGFVTLPIAWTTLSLSARHAHRNARMHWPRWMTSAPGLGSPSRSTNEMAQPPLSRFSVLRWTRKPPSSTSSRTSWSVSDPFSRTVPHVGPPQRESPPLCPPPSNQAEQVVLLRSDLVEAVCC